MVYYAIALFSWGLFLIQTILSWILGDIDIDVDLDGDVDFSIGDILSFKGAIHFMMGFSAWTAGKMLFLHQPVLWYDICIGVMAGILFAYILYRSYNFIFKLQHHPGQESGLHLVGRPCTIYLALGDGRYVVDLIISGAMQQIDVVSKSKEYYSVGQKVIITEYSDGTYFIN